MDRTLTVVRQVAAIGSATCAPARTSSAIWMSATSAASSMLALVSRYCVTVAVVAAAVELELLLDEDVHDVVLVVFASDVVVGAGGGVYVDVGLGGGVYLLLVVVGVGDGEGEGDGGGDELPSSRDQVPQISPSSSGARKAKSPGERSSPPYGQPGHCDIVINYHIRGTGS